MTLGFWTDIEPLLAISLQTVYGIDFGRFDYVRAASSSDKVCVQT